MRCGIGRWRCLRSRRHKVPGPGNYEEDSKVRLIFLEVLWEFVSYKYEIRTNPRMIQIMNNSHLFIYINAACVAESAVGSERVSSSIVLKESRSNFKFLFFKSMLPL